MHILKEKENLIIRGIKSVLQHYFTAPVLLLYGVLCWMLGISEFLIFCYLFVFIFMLLFCDDLKNIFPMVLYVSYMIEDINWGAPVKLYAMVIAVAVVALALFLIKNILSKKIKLKKGEMFVGCIFAIVAFSIGGIQRFNISYFLATLGLFTATYVLYFIALNFTVDFKKYLSNLFLCGAIIITVQLVIGNYRLGFFHGIDKHVVYLGAQNINVVAEMFFFGAVSAVYLGLGKKNDWVYWLFGLIPIFGIFMTFCRTMYFTVAVVTLFITIIMIIKSPNRKALIIGFACLLVALTVFCLINIKFILEQIEPMLEKFGDNGRLQVLWPWCWGKFHEYPYFGFGFVADEHIPNTYAKFYVVLAHNTPLQWLTSLGVVGSSILVYFYLEKYRLVFRRMTMHKLVYISLLIGLAFAGIFDQAPTMDFFMFLTPFLVIASFENNEWK